MAAQFHFDAGDIADEAASGEVDPHIPDISACDPFGLLDRFAHCLLGTFHVRDIAAPHTSAFALACAKDREFAPVGLPRSEEHTSELQSLMRISYAVFCLKKKNTNTQQQL